MIKKIHFPFIRGFAGGDIYFDRLTQALDTNHYRYEKDEYSYLKVFFKNFFQISNPKADLIHTTDETGSAFHANNIPFIVTSLHLPFDNYYWKYCSLKQKLFYKYWLYAMIKKSFSNADVIIAISKYTKQSIEHTFGRNFNLHVIYPGVDIHVFKPGITRKEDHKVRLLYTGNLIKRKGIDLLPRIMSILGEKYVLYYTSGLRESIPRQFNLSNMVPLERLSEEELIKEYQKCDILLFPSRLEGFGYSVAEAMSCGKPVITTNCSSLPELVINNKGGFLCEIDNVADFIEKIIMLSKNKCLMEIMGKFNRRRIIKKFNLKKMRDEYQQLYNKFIDN